MAPISAVLVYLHLSAIREEAEKRKNKFNAEYKPEQTDCTVDLSFTKAGVDKISISLGLSSSCPQSGLAVIISEIVCFRTGVIVHPVDSKITNQAHQSHH